LDEVLDHYGGKTLLLLEIKCRERRGDRRRLQRLMDLTLAMARQRNLADQVLILCFDLALLAYGHDQDPTFRFVLNQDRSGGLQPGADFLFAYSLRQNLLKPSRVKTIQGAGKPVLTYTCNQASQVRRALSCGVNAIMTDHPPWLTQLLAKLNSVPA
jgi:glycerophosphoryl diester phosphodiesterase